MPNSFAFQHTTLEFKILVVEDDNLLNEQMSELLTAQGYAVTSCFDGDDALHLAVTQSFNLILLDVMLPGKDGLTMLNILRSCNNTPVIIVSAKHAEEERIKGLSAGADDYLAKPFNSQELLLRVDSVLRRAFKQDGKAPYVTNIEGLEVDSLHQQVSLHGAVVSFTPIEFGLLHILIKNPGQILLKPFLYQVVLNKRFSQYDRSLDMHMSRIRKKLNNAGWDGTRLQTVHGKGYCIK
ncbi:putative transcriptional regulatory protein YedW [Pseudoalteromonas sp. P1-13-1a]|uniref:Response regulator transcription factor n=1 Tax=Pseudoalteromonas undina TaxID=43660 RepID=A0ACC6R8E3_9GAMM|nr:response regulator transcription factor [Pseudoalteromonas sp. P1-13-1a]KPZ60055.1 putative transcriptional regulatory protein YedW [Pseudoalteromonas sp. P1-13-1a]